MGFFALLKGIGNGEDGDLLQPREYVWAGVPYDQLTVPC